MASNGKRQWNGMASLALCRGYLLSITLVLADQFKTNRVPTHTPYVSEGAFLVRYTELLSYMCVKSMTPSLLTLLTMFILHI
jgi:hypothetical protein